MFHIDQKDIPSLPTRAAVLILDLQNDIVAEDGIIKANRPPDFMDNIFDLVPAFRSFGQVMWILTQYTTTRAVNDGGADAENVITDKELPADNRQARQRQRMSDLLAKARALNLDDDDEENSSSGADVDGAGEDEAQKDIASEEEVNETYLTLREDEEPRCCVPMTSGVNFLSSMMQGDNPVFNSQTDWIFGKTHYSAFKSGSLIDRLRSGMVHKLYICGALTNISIYATVLDAASHGYEITVISDCCGYKSEARHNEAIRRMIETTGCEIKTSSQIIKEFKDKERAESRQKNRLRLMQKPKPGSISKSKASESSSSGPSELRASEEVAPPRSPFRPNPQTIRSHLWAPVEPDLPARRSDDERAKSLAGLVSPSSSRQDASANKIRVKNKVSVRRRPSTSKSKQKGEPSSVVPAQLKKTSSSSADDIRETKTALEGEAKVDIQKVVEMPDLEKLTIKDDMPRPDTRDSSLAAGKSVATSGAKDTSIHPIISAPFCEGDSVIITNLLPEPLTDYFYRNLLSEVIWQRMSHMGGDVPRLVAVQGHVSPNGTHPIYRHPADELPPLSPFSKTVRQIIPYVEVILDHAVNHVLIQFYRNGTDHITEHSDKTLDIVPKTFIANVSLGAQRTMVFRTKKSSPIESDAPPQFRTVHRETLPHNSMCKLGPKSNAVWLHGIRPDKRAESEKSSAELSYQGSRISLTFRNIGTFLNRNETLIWGQGAVAKDEKSARKVVTEDEQAAKSMIEAFGKENKMGTEFDWEANYGGGFDIVHVTNDRRLVLNGVENVGYYRIRILTNELDLKLRVDSGTTDSFRPIRLDSEGKEVLADGAKKEPTFVDNDAKRSRVEGCFAILLYLDRVYGSSTLTGGADFDMGKCYTRILQAFVPLEQIQEELPIWESHIAEHGSEGYVAGSGISMADVAFWPALHVLQSQGKSNESQVLKDYYERISQRESFKWVIDEDSDSD